MSNKSQKIKKALLIVVVALFAALSIAAPIASVYADDDAYNYVPPAGNVGAVQDKMRDEARAQLTVKTLLNCLGGGVNRNTSWSDTENTKKWFDRLGNDMTVTTGYWYEKSLTGKYDDGQINCSETGSSDVISLAAKQLGVQKKDVLCDGTAAGIAMNKDGYNCGKSDGKYTRNGNNGGDGLTKISVTDSNGITSTAAAQGWFKHVKKLYDSKKSAEGWETSIYNIATYGGMAGYFLYRTEIGEKCGGVVETYDTKPADMNMVLKDVTQSGVESGKSQAGKVVYKKYGQNSNFSHEFVVNDYVSNCSSMINRANDDKIWKAYRDRMLVVLNNMCREDIEKRKAAVESRGGEMNEETQAAYDAAVADVSKYKAGNFLTGDEENGWTCADIGDWAGAEQSDPTADEEPAERGKVCMDNAGALGWIACTLAEGVSNAIQNLYEKWVVPYLEVHASMFSTEGENNVFNAWQIFQNFANLFFIGVLFFIIFSQITGYGIDNYGIKRTLPKLIVGAVLINTSFVISALAVDLSNILGIGIGDLFKGITANISVSSISVDDASASGGGGIVTFAAVGAGATAVGLGLITIISSAVSAGPMLFYGGIALLIPVLMALLSIFLAILFFFLLLCLRQALIVILVVISPVAFACYMLTNTKPLFSKWLKAFQGALLVYPIASALVYGGQSIGTLLIAADAGTSGAGSGTVSVQMMLAAAVMSIAPIFLIPSAVKSSMGGLANLTNKMSGAVGGRANKLGSKAQSSYADTPLARRMADSRKAAENDKMMANVRSRQNKLEAKKAKGDLNARERREYARNASLLAGDSDRIIGEHAAAYKNSSQSDILSQFGGLQYDDDGNSSFAEGGNFSSFIGKDGKLDVNKAAAALSSINDVDKRTKAYQALAGTEAFKAAMTGANGMSNRSIMAGAMGAGKGDIAGAAIAKNLMKGSEDFGADGESLKKKIQGLGTSVMTGADKDTFMTEGMGDMLSKEQLAEGIRLGYTGSTAKNFNEMLSGVNEDTRNQVAKAMSEDQIGGLTMDSLQALTGMKLTDDNGNFNVTDEAQLAALRAKFDANTLQALGSDSGDAIRSRMSSDVLAALGIERTKGPQQVIVVDHSDTSGGSTGPAPTSGGPAPNDVN